MKAHSVTLRDTQTGSEVEILTSRGFNCYQFRAAFESEVVDVLWAEPRFENGAGEAARSGMPLLFPYPGRIQGKTLHWQGRDYPLEGDDGLGNAIHGYVLDRPWRVLEQTASRVVGQFQAAVDAPELQHAWPSDFRITAAYELAGRTLLSRFHIENPGDRPLPFGFGAHPYFRAPLRGSAADQCRVILPLAHRWELENMLPTGRQIDAFTQPACGASDEAATQLMNAANLRRGMAFADITLDDVFTGLEFVDGWCSCRIHDAASKRELTLKFDESFRACVVYTPSHREAISIEPLTCVPNAYELSQQNIDAGLRVLSPGESLQLKLKLQVE